MDINMLKSRKNIYALISRLLLLEIDRELLDMIKSNSDILEFFPNLSEWRKFKEYESEKLIEEELNVDFSNVSLLHLIPYESFYRRDDQMVESGGANPVIEFYNRYDFRVDLGKARAISADHIGIELEFMHLLVESEIKAAQDDNLDIAKEFESIQREFLENHLLKFAPLYLINMKNESRTPLYHDLAEMSLEFILSDYEYLNRV